MKILKSEKEKLLKWVNKGYSVYQLLDYLCNVCRYPQIYSKEIIDNIDNIEVFDETIKEYNLQFDGINWFLEEYQNNECIFAVMGKSVLDCYRQMFRE